LIDGPAPPALDRSRSPEAYSHLAVFNDDRNLTSVFGVFQHPLESIGIVQDIDVVERNSAAGVILTGP
jgi:hypothetical protein